MLQLTTMIRLSSVALAASAVGLYGCERQEPRRVVQPTPPAISTPASITADPVLDRSALLQAMSRAASVYAAGEPAPDATLVGRRFVVRQAFGCGGAVQLRNVAEPEGQAIAALATDMQSVRLMLLPGDWLDKPIVAGGPETWEAAEGFWLTRPWMQTEGCPVATPEPTNEGAATSPQTVGLAAVFETGGSRLQRRNGRAYSFTIRSENGEPMIMPAGGYRLVLEGRMSAFGDGRAVRCRAASPDERPVCIGAVQLDRVAFEGAAGAVLGEWAGG